MKTLRTKKSESPMFSFAFLESVQRDTGIVDAFSWNNDKDLLKGSIYEFARIFAKCLSGHRGKCVGANHGSVLCRWSDCCLLDSEKKAKLDKVPAKHNDLAKVCGAHLWGKQVCGRVALVSPPVISKLFLGLTGI